MKLLLAASTGGHLAQLVRIEDSIGQDADSLWVTFDSAQSRSLLAGRRVLYIPYVKPRDWRGVVRAALVVGAAIRRERFDAAISTGAGLALAVFAVAKLRALRCIYIESVSRTDGPSLTGRIIEFLRLAHLYTQHESWSDHRWQFAGSVLASYESYVDDELTERSAKIFVTLGTIKPFRFDAAVDAVLALDGIDRDSIVWQLGVTTRDDLPGRVTDYLNAEQFENSAKSADIVVTHAGVGTILQLLSWGMYPVVLTRRSRRKEHIDDHQQYIAKLLQRHNLAKVVEVDELDEGAIGDAFNRRVRPLLVAEKSRSLADAVTKTVKGLASRQRVDYLVGGIRISLGSDSNTPGPRTHVTEFCNALVRENYAVDMYLASTMPLMGRFSRIRQVDYSKASFNRVVAADCVRLATSIWCGATTLVKSARMNEPAFIYERVAVMQSLSSFHRHKRDVTRVVESNGIMSRETAVDRGALAMSRVAAAIERHVYRRADLVVAVSEPLAREIENFAGISSERLLVVPNGLVSSSLQGEHVDRTERVVGFAGSLNNWCSVDRLLRAVRSVLDQDPEIILDKVQIVGDGPKLASLVDLADKLGIGSIVEFRGRVSKFEAESLIGTWTVGYAGHVKTSAKEMYHSPLKVYEYAAALLDVVATYSNDAEALAATGLRVRFYNDQQSLNIALAEILSLPKLAHSEKLELLRGLSEQHTWEARVRSVVREIVCVSSRVK